MTSKFEHFGAFLMSLKTMENVIQIALKRIFFFKKNTKVAQWHFALRPQNPLASGNWGSAYKPRLQYT